MPICDIWCYTLQDSHNKLEACRVLMGKVESSDVYFLAAYILSSLQSFLQPLIFRFRIHARTSRPTTTMKRANQSLLTYLFHLFPFSSYLSVKQYLTLHLNFLRRNDILRSLEILGNKREFGFIFKMNIGITELIQLTNKSIDSFFWYGSIDAWNLFIFFFSNIEKGKDLS